MVPNDILLFELRGVLLGQQVRLPMFYRVVAFVAEPEVTFPLAMAEASEALWLTIFDGTAWAETTSAGMEYQTFRAYNLFDVLDNYEGNADGALPVSGGAVGTAMPPFSAFAWYQGTTRRDIRSGSRRWPGMSELHQNNGIVEAGILSVMGDVATAMSMPLTIALPSDGVLTITPVIVGREKEVDEDGKVTYRLPTTQAEARYYPATSWVPRANVSSQNTRKLGRGI